ncbi:MAG: hypothetical protein EBZ47_04980 [Chlamydiae bacterium]|nr:hypothetical protein [Chlamydiota bacterium]
MSTAQPALEKFKEALTSFIKEEIRLSREILYSLHQEEIALVMLDKNSLHKIWQERFPLVEKIGILRQQRNITTDQMMEFLRQNPPRQNFPAQQNLPFLNSLDCEGDLLVDQLFSLIDKLNSQNSKNELLAKTYQKYSLNFASIACPFHPLRNTVDKANKKATVGTIPR